MMLSLIVFGLSVAVASSMERTNHSASVATWNAGDKQSWALKDFDDADWSKFVGLSKSTKGIFWIRQPIIIDSDNLISPNNVINIKGTGAFDVYFDGKLLGSSGIVGAARQDEKPGALQFDLGLPRDFLKNGDHVLAIRASANHLREASDFTVSYQLRSADQTFTRKSLNLILLGVVLAAIVIVSVYNAASSVSRQQPKVFVSTLAVALGISSISAIEASEALGFTLYSWRFAIDLVAASAALLIFFVLPILLLLRFSIERWKFWFAGLVLPLAFSAFEWGDLAYEHDTRVFISLSAYCLAICAYASSKGMKQANYYAISLCICLLGILIDPESMHVFLVALAIFLALGFALDIRAQELSAQRSQLAAVRLEAEMIKRNIQPHFLMNSLTAITEWIETAPTEALRFIHGLAEEFRSLSKLSGQKLVPLTDEIELCQTHLLLMGMRQKKMFHLETNGLNGNETVPPGIFHTLIENAVSHNRYRGEKTVFEIDKFKTDDETQYIFHAPMGIITDHKKHSTGSGVKYITSRLEESYPGRWQFTSQEVDGHWVTKITLKG